MRIIPVGAMLLLSAVAVVADEGEQAAERRALAFVQAVGTGEVDAAWAAFEENFGPSTLERRSEEEWRQMLERLTSDLAGLEVTGVEIRQEGQLEVLVSCEQGGARLGFGFSPDPPHLLEGLSVSLGGPDERAGPDLPEPGIRPGMSDREIGAALDAFFADLTGRDLFHGAALVARDGAAIFRGAWGLANREWQAANSIDTRFDIGSINKHFTKIAVAQLVSRGRLSLDDTLAARLPDYPDPEVAAKVTVRHLVEHSSGLGDIFNDRWRRAAKSLFRTPRDFFFLFADEPLLFEPGSRRQYSNAGYQVLGAVVEAAAGEPYDDHVAREIFARAGMTRTGFFARDEVVPGVAVGYTRRSPHAPPGELRNNLFLLAIKGSPAGSAFSTVDDLLALDNAVRDHELLPPAWSRWVLGGPEPEPGVEVPPERLRAGIGLAGGAPGVSAVIESNDRLAVIVLSNYDEPGAEAIARKLRGPLRRAVGGS